MPIENAIDLIGSAPTLDALTAGLQRIIGNYGFSSFSFVDVGDPSLDRPYFVTTTPAQWNADYQGNGFVHVDPVIPVVRRTNRPFSWGEVTLPERKGRRKPGALKTMEAARDHGFQDGFVVPFHFVDRMRRPNSASCVLFWNDPADKFRQVKDAHALELHAIMLLYAQRAIDLADNELGRRNRLMRANDVGTMVEALTDRERDVLAWAARGKTMTETSTILRISDETVEDHIRSAMRKLHSVNKTQAVAKAIFLGMIDV